MFLSTPGHLSGARRIEPKDMTVADRAIKDIGLCSRELGADNSQWSRLARRASPAEDRLPATRELAFPHF